jgi:hypothetical protein
MSTANIPHSLFDRDSLSRVARAGVLTGATDGLFSSEYQSQRQSAVAFLDPKAGSVLTPSERQYSRIFSSRALMIFEK